MLNRNKKILYSAILLVFAAIPVLASGQSDLPVFAFQDRVGDASAILAASELEAAGVFKTIRFSSGNLCAEALITANADAATMGDAVAVNLASRYPNMVVILGVHGEGSSRHRLVSHNTNPEKIGVKFGTSTHAALLAWLEIKGLSGSSPDYPVLIDMSPSIQISALESGEIEALAASEPTPSIAEDKLSEPGGLSGYSAEPLQLEGRRFPLVLVTTRKSLQRYPEQLAELESALFSNGNLLSRNLNGISSAQVDILLSVTGLSRSLLEKTLSFHQFGFSEFSGYQQEMSALADFMMSGGSISTVPDWTRVSE